MTPLPLKTIAPLTIEDGTVFIDQRLELDFVSDRSANTYHMTVGHQFIWCSCPGFTRWQRCRHVTKAAEWLEEHNIRFELSEEHYERMFKAFDRCAEAIL